MQVNTYWVWVLLGILMFGTVQQATSAAPPEPPPRGKAFGYFLKDGERVLFVYLEDDGSRLIELSQCRQNRRYRIHCSQDLVNWAPLAEVQADSQGKASFTDTAPLPHCFYTVSSIR
jgi:hypothetical protein